MCSGTSSIFMSASQPLVSLISINYNQLEVTTELLDSVRAQDYENYELILVDNASKEDPSAYIESNYPWVRMIRSEENLGFSGGNNLGIANSSGTYLFFVNNDTVLTQGLIQTLVNTLRSNTNIGLISPLICYGEQTSDGKDLIQYAGTTPVSNLSARNKTIGEKEPDEGQYSGLKPTAYAHGAAMMLPRAVYEKVGGMPEFFFLYYEELDWSERIRNAGYDICVQADAKIYHKESVSVGPASPLKTYYQNRNRILFVRRHRNLGQRLLFALWWMMATVPKWSMHYILKGKWTHLRAFWKAMTWHLVNGSVGPKESGLHPSSSLKTTTNRASSPEVTN